jgi:Holliday junction resolvase RusA-like endonuclease
MCCRLHQVQASRSGGSHPMKFFVQGVPVPKGSAKAFYNKRIGRAQVVQDNAERQKPWASLISLTAAQETGSPLWKGPVSLSLVFTMPRPKKHYFTGKRAHVLRPDAPVWHTSHTGDLDKLVRLVKDSLTGIVWVDDCQVAQLDNVKKVYGATPGVDIEVVELEEDW